MLKSKGIVTFIEFNLCLALAACSAHPAGDEYYQPGQSKPVTAAEQGNDFEIITWMDKPEPVQGETVIFIGNIHINGFQQAGVMMEASWPGEAQKRGDPSCVVPVVYQRGVCYIDTSNFESGETVPVKLKFRLSEKTFTGETSFTVR